MRRFIRQCMILLPSMIMLARPTSRRGRQRVNLFHQSLRRLGLPGLLAGLGRRHVANFMRRDPLPLHLVHEAHGLFPLPRRAASNDCRLEHARKKTKSRRDGTEGVRVISLYLLTYFAAILVPTGRAGSPHSDNPRGLSLCAGRWTALARYTLVLRKRQSIDHRFPSHVERFFLRFPDVFSKGWRRKENKTEHQNAGWGGITLVRTFSRNGSLRDPFRA